jgi:hypothetical protein
MKRILFLACSALVLGTAACSEPLDVEFPGRIPTGQLNDPSLAQVLVNSVLGDFECAYSNYSAASAFQSDEYETANSNLPGALWGERGISAADDWYVTFACEDAGLAWGLHRPLHTARFQSERIFAQLNEWTDEQVPNRTLLLATTRAYGAYTYLIFGETFCSISFDGGPEEQPSASLAIAETQFAEAIALAQQAGAGAAATDILNLARVGLARTKMNLEKWSEAATAAQQVPSGYKRDVTRGSDNSRRWNDLHRGANEVAGYVVADAYRNLNDPRPMVVDAGRGAFNPTVRLWVTNKYTSNASPIRLASYQEAQLILAEALIEQGQVSQGMDVINAGRAAVGLGALTAGTQAEARAALISERQKELSFEGGHRLNDLLRKNIPWKVGSNAYTGRPYGVTTCWPYPLKEVNGA